MNEYPVNHNGAHQDAAGRPIEAQVECNCLDPNATQLDFTAFEGFIPDPGPSGWPSHVYGAGNGPNQSQPDFSSDSSEPLFSSNPQEDLSFSHEADWSDSTVDSDGNIHMTGLDDWSRSTLANEATVNPQNVTIQNGSNTQQDVPMYQSNTGECDADLEFALLIQSLTLSDEQQDTFNRYKIRFEREQRFPDDTEIGALAVLERLPTDTVRFWFEILLSQFAPLFSQPAQAAMDSNGSASSSEDPLRKEIWKWIRDRFGGECNKTRPTKPPGNARYHCTCGCGYVTNSRDAWQRHEQTWQHKDIWHCVICREIGRGAFKCVRFDKLPDHFRKIHPKVPETDYDRLRDESKVDIAEGFEKKCKFYNETTGEECGYEFEDWEDRTDHYLNHFRRNYPDGPERVRYGRHKWFDDDEDENDSHMFQGQLSGNASSSSTKEKGKGRATTSSQASSSYQNSGSYSYHYEALSNKEIRLLYIEPGNSGRNLRCSLRTHVIDEVPQYTAISYCWGTKNETDTILINERPFQIEKKLGKILDHLRSENAWSTLWIDTICIDQSKPVERNEQVHMMWDIYRNAKVTLVCREHRSAQSDSSFRRCAWDDYVLKSWPTRSWVIQERLSSPRIEYLHIEDLGRGAFGVVDKVQLLSTGAYLARKSLPEPGNRKRIHKGPLHEIRMMRKMHHPNIVQFVAAYRERERVNILMSPVADCNLKDFLSDPDRWPEKQSSLLSWFKPLASAVKHLHDRRSPVVHQDIKPSNILLDGNRIVLADFGLSSSYSSAATPSRYSKNPGTPAYCAPELVSGEHSSAAASPKVDVWALGCVFVEMATVLLGRSLADLQHHLRFHEDRSRRDKTYHNHRKELVQWLASLQNLTRESYESSIIQLCEKMLHRDPGERPTAQDVFIVCDAGGGTVDLVSFQLRRLNWTSGTPGSEKSSLARAKRMSWAASRRTNREEDEASCMLGIFGVNMPLLYGQGKNAFIRLQEEIVRAVLHSSKQALSHILLVGGLGQSEYLLEHLRANCGGGHRTADVLLRNGFDVETSALSLQPYTRDKIYAMYAMLDSGCSERRIPYMTPQQPGQAPHLRSHGCLIPSWSWSWIDGPVPHNTRHFSRNDNGQPESLESKSLRLGAVKANIGHVEGASGISSLLKSILMIRRSYIRLHARSEGHWDITPRNILWTNVPSSRKHSSNRKVFLNNSSTVDIDAALIAEDEQTTCTLRDGHELQCSNPPATLPTRQDRTATTVQRVLNLYDFVPTESGAPELNKNDIIAVLESEYKDWWRFERWCQTSISPLNYIEKSPRPMEEESDSDIQMEASRFSKIRNLEGVWPHGACVGCSTRTSLPRTDRNGHVTSNHEIGSIVYQAYNLRRLENEFVPGEDILRALKNRQRASDTGDRSPPLRILSLDGGGIRGYSSLLMLQEIMRQAGNSLPQSMDIVLGTSTGGLIALTLNRLRSVWIDALCIHQSDAWERHSQVLKMMEMFMQSGENSLDCSHFRPWKPGSLYPRDPDHDPLSRGPTHWKSSHHPIPPTPWNTGAPWPGKDSPIPSIDGKGSYYSYPQAPDLAWNYGSLSTPDSTSGRNYANYASVAPSHRPNIACASDQTTFGKIQSRCGLCHVNFDTRSSLDHHFRSHQRRGQQTYADVVRRYPTHKTCEERFLFKKDLKRHMASHNAELHCCEGCNDGFSGKNHLKRHMTTRHAGQLSKKFDACRILRIPLGSCATIFTGTGMPTMLITKSAVKDMSRVSLLFNSPVPLDLPSRTQDTQIALRENLIPTTATCALIPRTRRINESLDNEDTGIVCS